jgi:hypothetical protein
MPLTLPLGLLSTLLLSLSRLLLLRMHLRQLPPSPRLLVFSNSRRRRSNSLPRLRTHTMWTLRLRA